MRGVPRLDVGVRGLRRPRDAISDRARLGAGIRGGRGGRVAVGTGDPTEGQRGIGPNLGQIMLTPIAFTSLWSVIT